MAAELLMVAERRRFPSVEVHPGADVSGEPLAAPVLRQFVRANGALRPRARTVPSAERCPVAAVRLEVAG